MPLTQMKSATQLTAGRWVRPSTPEDGPAIVALMREAGLEPHVEPRHMHWKYWQERADWPGCRSYVLTDGHKLLAHGAVVPGMLRWGDTQARVLHGIDWAARRDAVGAGVVLMKHIGRMTDFLLGIGGSSHTLKILPLIGYSRVGTVAGYVRSLSPVAILRRPARSGWKLVPRFARSVLWSLSAPNGDMAGWLVRLIAPQDVEQIAEVLPRGAPGIAAMIRSVAMIRHALACPIVPVELYALERAERVVGYFVLSYAPGQARLVDLWVNSEDPASWLALVRSAVAQARRRGGLAELVVWSNDSTLSQTLMRCGFHERVKLPIYLRPSAKMSPPDGTVRVQMLDNDALYLYFGRNELWA